MSATPPSAAILADLDARGLVHDSTDREALAALLDEGVTTLYCGFDPTADSLHLGHLVPLLMLRRFQLAGHRPIALAGGATGMIGDPGGRTDERVLLDADVLAANTVAISRQLERFLDFEAGPTQAILVDNRSWTEGLGVIDFLRDIGKHLTVNQMMAKESVRSRLDREQGISYTEFSYMLLQANDFVELSRRYGCRLQVAGSDQWGNITAGIELLRKRDGISGHGLTAPLVTRSDGTKFGKSSGSNVWLDPARTSPYAMYQYLLGVEDADVGRLLLQLTLLPVDRCREVAAAHAAEPHRRVGQRELARAVVALLHGDEVLAPIEAASAVVAGGEVGSASFEALELLEQELPTFSLPGSELDADGGADLLALFARDGVGLAKSKGEVRRNLGGYRLNGGPVAEGAALTRDELLHGRWALLGRGRSAQHRVLVVVH